MSTATEELTWDDIKERLSLLADHSGEWAGIPLVIKGPRLIVEPKYPWQGLQNATLSKEHELGLDDGYEVVNTWTTLSRWCRVYVVREKSTGKTFAIREPIVGGRKFVQQLECLAALPAWDVNAEANAMEKLKGMLSHKRAMWNAYCLTGSFLETSLRSGVTYLFRRLRPTVAIKGDEDGMKILAALCLHPIGYYAGSHAGVMTPTDDVIAHLGLMRACEHRFWKMANQHPAWHPEAAI